MAKYITIDKELVRDLLVTGESSEGMVTGFYVPISFPGCSGMKPWERHYIYTGQYIYHAMREGEYDYYVIDDPKTIRKATREEIDEFFRREQMI